MRDRITASVSVGGRSPTWQAREQTRLPVVATSIADARRHSEALLASSAPPAQGRYGGEKRDVLDDVPMAKLVSERRSGVRSWGGNQ
jgi:hypothetical protein